MFPIRREGTLPSPTGREPLEPHVVETSRRRTPISNTSKPFARLFSIERRKTTPTRSNRIEKKPQRGSITPKAETKPPPQPYAQLLKRRRHPEMNPMVELPPGRCL